MPPPSATQRREFPAALMRAGAACAALTAPMLAWGERLIEPGLAMFAGVVELLLPDFAVTSIDVRSANGEAVIAAVVTLRHYAVYGGHLVEPGASITASTLLAHAWQPALIIAAIVAVRRHALWTQFAATLLRASLAFAAVALLDIPFVLAGAVEDMLAAATVPRTNPPLVAWMNFLNGGGRLALAAAGGIAAVATVGRRVDPV